MDTPFLALLAFQLLTFSLLMRTSSRLDATERDLKTLLKNTISLAESVKQNINR
jgi:hypothetical protein